MSATVELPPPNEVHGVLGERLLRRLHRILPLGRKYGPLLSLLNSSHGLMAVPFDRFHVVCPAAWRKQAITYLLLGPDVVPEFRLLAPICRKLDGGLWVDAGANIGLYTLLMRALQPTPIVAYEPQPFLFQLLQWNIGYNRLVNVETRNVACGERCGEVPFTIGINGSIPVGVELPPAAKPQTAEAKGSHWEEAARLTRDGHTVINVPLVTLDKELADGPAVSLLKIDCEGFEFNILQGARRLLERHKPVLFLEVHPALLEKFGHSVELVLDLLAPSYDLEFWCFQTAFGKSKLARSLSKFRRGTGQRYADATKMLAAVRAPSRPFQMYWIGQPKKRGA